MAVKPISETAVLLHDWFRRGIEDPLAGVVGGRERLRIITLLACVLSLDAADKATVGAVATPLQHALHIGPVQLGWLITASTAIGALITLPFGALADRVHRVRLLAACILAWSVTMLVSGMADSYTMLLLSRFALGAVAAAALPIAVSLTGDFFLARERGRILGYILVGELLGIAFGFLISGNLAAIYSWRVPFWIMAGLGLILAFVIWRHLPEPERGRHASLPPLSDNTEENGSEPATRIRQHMSRDRIKPRQELVLDCDAAQMPLWDAVRHVLAIPSFRGLIIASALGYFFFAGLRTFGVVFVRDHFGMSQSMASTVSVCLGLGSIVGVLLVGHFGDRLITNGRLNGRVLLGGIAFLVASAALTVGLMSPSLALAAPFFILAAAGIGGANPAVDASRLDVVPAALWGRAEGVRTSLRFALAAIAPPLFGWVTTWFGGAQHAFSDAASGRATDSAGLQQTFLILLPSLLIAGLILVLRVRRTYARDAATALVSRHKSSSGNPA